MKTLLLTTITAILLFWCNTITTKTIQPSNNVRIPIAAPTKCRGNQLLYPLHNYDWICDCAPGYLYYQPKDDCFAIYKQGPCRKGQHLILNNQQIVECVTNPCPEGFAIYKGKCWELEKPDGPCPPVHEGGGILNVNLTTLHIECVENADLLSIFKTPQVCPPGSRRDIQNICRENFNV